MAEQRHSSAYHRYFEDYAERQVLGPGGAVRTERVYVGKYYRVSLPDRALRRQRLGFAALYLLSAALLLLGGVLLPVSSVGFVAVPAMAALIAVLLLAVPVCYRLTVPREMEVRAWRDSSENLRRAGLGAAVCVLIFAGTSAAAALVLGRPLADAAGVPLCLLSALCCLTIHFMEKRTPYEILPPKQSRPSMSSPIRYYSSD